MKTISMWKNVGRFDPPKIAREDLPLKSSVQFTPPKLPGKIYPSNHLYNLPPLKSPGKIYPSNCLYDLPPPEIAFISNFLPPKSDIN